MPTSRVMTAPEIEVSEPVATPSASARKSTASGLFAQPLAPLLTVLAVAALAMTAILTARTAGMVAALWAANGLAAAVWLRSGRGLGFDLAFGGLMAFGLMAAQFLAGNSPVMSAVFTVANMVEIVLAVLLARRFAPALNLASVEGACRFIVSTAIVAPAVSGALAASALHFINGAPFMQAFQTWWFGHALGLAVIGTFTMSVDMRAIRAMSNPWRVAETVLLFGLLTGVCLTTYFFVNMPLGFVMVPLLILIAARLRVIGVTAALVVIAVLSLSSLMMGVGPWHLVIGDRAERAMLLQLTILFGYLPILLVASLLEERDRLSARAKVGQIRAEKASEAKSRLLANVAHEIKSPIGGIIGIGDLWASGQLGPVSATQAEMSAMLVKTARQVEALSHDLLDVARAESGAVKVELRPTDIRGILEDVRRAAALRPEAKMLKLTTVFESDGLVALADSQRLAQVIDNLATNAVKYGASGKEIVFRARRIHDGVRIEVIDHGPGLSPEKQAQLFEPFNRLGLERSSVEGHGIGLALAKRLVELQGGSIGVDSTPGEGSTFWIELSVA